MAKRRELKRKRPPRSRFFDLDGDIYIVTERDADGLDAVRLDPADAELVRRMRNDSDIEIEAAVLARRR
jgi:hypothetical protein